MSEIMTRIPFAQLMRWIASEYSAHGSVFGVRKAKFYKNSGKVMPLFGGSIASPVGPAAGPNSQLSQNIVASYLSGARFIELKTVQKMDGEALRNCVPRPCIFAEDECYNVEWSTELTVEEALEEYIHGYLAIRVMAIEWGLCLDKQKDFLYSMSVGYDLDGIKSPKIDNFIESMKDAKDTAAFQNAITYLLEHVSEFQNVTEADIRGIESTLCNQVTLSTLHGCPPAEIERIATYLLTEKKIHTYVKCNPTLLGYGFVRGILDDMGYGYVTFDEHHFNNDLQYHDAVPMFERLRKIAGQEELSFGLKLTNTFPVKITRQELPGEEMYMSGRSLFPLTIHLALRMAKEFSGKVPISFSGGADYFNLADLLKTGIAPITVATTILKPGGYERFYQLAFTSEAYMSALGGDIDIAALEKLANAVVQNRRHKKNLRVVKSRKTAEKLPLFDCAKAPCKQGGCPIEQQIPEYVDLVAHGKYDEAFALIAIDNANPAITGTICNHECQNKCTRMDYEAPIHIRAMKLHAVQKAQDAYIDSLQKTALKTDKKVAVIGAGPAGVSMGYFLRRNGVEVTVFEKKDKPFGIVEYVIPSFRIEAKMMEKDYRLAQKTGVNFVFGANQQYDVQKLKQEYDYVVLATGAWEPGFEPFKTGVEKTRDALEFLQSAKERENDVPEDLGKNIAVIGGGDVAMDCARVAKRNHPDANVCLVYRRTREFMPATFEEIELAIVDGVTVMELLAPVSYDGKELECEVMELSAVDASGRRGVVGTAAMQSLKFDTVICAVGARVDHALFAQNGVALDGKDKPNLNDCYETNLPGVYIAGDCRKGPSTIVQAIADAKRITMDILSKLELPHDFVRVLHDAPMAYTKKGVMMQDHTEATDGLRCLSCDQVCELCVDVCPNRANTCVVVQDGSVADPHQILHLDGMCNECGNCAVFCPYDGRPYTDKYTLFWTEEGFADSNNVGFLPLGNHRYKVRTEEYTIIEHSRGEENISAQMRAMIQVVEQDYSFYLPK